MTVTIDDLKTAQWRALMFMDGTDPKHMQVRECVGFPRLTMTWVMKKDGSQGSTFFVDQKPVASYEAARGQKLKMNPLPWDAILAALNAPPTSRRDDQLLPGP